MDKTIDPDGLKVLKFSRRRPQSHDAAFRGAEPLLNSGLKSGFMNAGSLYGEVSFYPKQADFTSLQYPLSLDWIFLPANDRSISSEISGVE